MKVWAFSFTRNFVHSDVYLFKSLFQVNKQVLENALNAVAFNDVTAIA